MMTKEDFIKGYCERFGVAWAELSEFRVALPCACEDEGCEGWAMVSRDPLILGWHLFTCTPDGESRSLAIPFDRRVCELFEFFRGRDWDEVIPG